MDGKDKVCLPALGASAPTFTANTTQGRVKLSDYLGEWLVFFSHPGDFTPVCTTEFIEFSKAYPQFVKRNTNLLGLSIDSNPSHLAWVDNIYQNTGIEIPFPIIADRDMKISKMYGMISSPTSDTQTIRSVFIIDDKGIVRTILYYPLTTGRNIKEILRIVDALQVADKYNVVTPANWVPGNDVIVLPPKTQDEMEERMENEDGYDCMDWYLCKKKL